MITPRISPQLNPDLENPLKSDLKYRTAGAALYRLILPFLCRYIYTQDSWGGRSGIKDTLAYHCTLPFQYFGSKDLEKEIKCLGDAVTFDATSPFAAIGAGGGIGHPWETCLVMGSMVVARQLAVTEEGEGNLW
ncbi:hypothetical protein L2E82_23023 [Cichorium intybus]|uniref:Uncharacterized protein n=1 Tax=Cichorium intybus TaxID=13427 RepID=A0ACB9DYV3_CICIN|nr:hypothetical protein L2E82_23023 [Cichorium intybus]